jgi:hypothetical protein
MRSGASSAALMTKVAEGRDRDKNRETAAIAGVFMADRTATIDHVGLRVPPQPDLCDLSET